MTPAEAKKAKVGTSVVWSNGDKGTIVEKGEAGIGVQWEDGTRAAYLYSAVHGSLSHLQVAK